MATRRWPSFAPGDPVPLHLRVDNGHPDGDVTALAISIGELMHHVRIPNDATHAQVAKALRELADSIEAAG